MTETVLLDLRPHPRALVLPVLSLLVVAGATGYGAARVAGEAAGLRLAVVAVAGALLTRLVLVPFLRWRATRFLLTDERVALRAGVLQKRGRDVALGRIDEVEFRRTLRQRVLGSGSLRIVAGDAEPLVVRDLRDVERVQEAVSRAVEALGRRPAPPRPPEP